MPGGLIDPAGRPHMIIRPFQHFCSATFGPGLRLRDFPHRNSAALSIANNVGRAPPPPTHACAPQARHNGVCPAQTRPPADTAHVSRWLRKGPAIRHHGLRSLVAAERAVPLQSSLTVSCSSHQVRQHAVMVLLLGALLLLVLWCCSWCFWSWWWLCAAAAARFRPHRRASAPHPYII